jgi:hypothetical protein
MLIERECSTLNRMHLGWNEIGKDGAEALAQGLAAAGTSGGDSWGCSSGVGDESGVGGVGEQEVQGLQVLDLRNNIIGAPGAAALAKALGIGIGIGHGDGGVSGGGSSSLRMLDLRSNGIGDRAGLLTNALQMSLAKNNTLRSLNLGDNGMASIGVLAFAQALGANRSLTHLDLEGMKPLPMQLQRQAGAAETARRSHMAPPSPQRLS